MNKLWPAILILTLLTSATPAAGDGWRVRLATNNDIFVNNNVQDDFYTFGNRLEITVRGWTFAWIENAFTDRVEEIRFDETYLTLGRLFSGGGIGGWTVWVEAGVARVGEGLLGQGAQNEVHRLIGAEPVFLEYLKIDDTYPHFTFEAGRQQTVPHSGGRLSTGPHVGLGTSIGFRDNAVVALRTIWQVSPRLAVDTIFGWRFADTELAELEERIAGDAAAAMVELRLPWNLFAEWSLNRYGTDREHLAFGFSFGRGAVERTRRGF